MSPNTAPMMPMVGEKPPADSKTLGMLSSCSAWLSSSNCIILRSSCGSVPSTASIRDFRMNGSWMEGKSASRETMPSLRALLANTTSCRTTCCGSSWRSKNTLMSRRNAAPTTGSGNWSITAPRVPPKTIIAAVGCRICEILPPSSRSPATTPPTPMANPAKLLLSTVGLRSAWRRIGEAMGVCELVAAGGRSAILCASKDSAAELQHAFDHLPGGLAHHQLLAVEQGDDGVRRLLDIFDEVGVERQARVVQAGELDHRRPRPGGRIQPAHRQKLPSA